MDVLFVVWFCACYTHVACVSIIIVWIGKSRMAPERSLVLSPAQSCLSLLLAPVDSCWAPRHHHAVSFRLSHQCDFFHSV